ncbi:MarR family transcriptional regulator [Sphingopyxis sp. BSN-002]|uniref:GbsR/MarR family transcriptional regulator n=1 Tax=Sphingopyxis sp. BSN-002 TaxID=2911495 RepID=UPI001EDC5FCB|nr:MarR family transcriptional regulator [Sphingopyxis sp. BSN-002]UKK83744.1 MarR family transcriptional regulator [Sphingopyxis sp. BSN-002]
MEHESKLPVAATEFILHWGNLGSQWGVNRSVAQIHALLFISDHPLHAEEIAELLGLARSNVSNSIKELLGWRLIERVPLLGDRRDHFTAETDIWEMVTRIAAGRKAREIDPAEAALKACVARAATDPELAPAAKARLAEMLDFVTTMSRWHDEMLNVPKPALMRLIRLGAGVTKLINWRPGRDKSNGSKDAG